MWLAHNTAKGLLDSLSEYLLSACCVLGAVPVHSTRSVMWKSKSHMSDLKKAQEQPWFFWLNLFRYTWWVKLLTQRENYVYIFIFTHTYLYLDFLKKISESNSTCVQILAPPLSNFGQVVWILRKPSVFEDWVFSQPREIQLVSSSPLVLLHGIWEELEHAVKHWTEYVYNFIAWLLFKSQFST